jgi:hypothetical protein
MGVGVCQSAPIPGYLKAASGRFFVVCRLHPVAFEVRRTGNASENRYEY